MWLRSNNLIKKLKWTKILILIFLCSSTTYAQKNVAIKGEIKANFLPASSVNIVNISQEIGTTSGLEGTFELKARENDTIVFSSIQYNSRTVIIDSLIFSKRFIQIELVEKVNNLEEVFISNISLTGNLKSDLASIEVFHPSSTGVPTRTKEPPSSIERKVMAANAEPRPEGIININLDRIIYQVNGKLEKLKKARNNEIKENLINKGISILPKIFFTNELNIPENEIKNFMYFCSEEPIYSELIKKQNHLGLTEYFFKKAPQYLNKMIRNPIKDNDVLYKN